MGNPIMYSLEGRTMAKTMEFPVCEECGKRHYKRAGKKCEFVGGEQDD